MVVALSHQDCTLNSPELSELRRCRNGAKALGIVLGAGKILGNVTLFNTLIFENATGIHHLPEGSSRGIACD